MLSQIVVVPIVYDGGYASSIQLCMKGDKAMTDESKIIPETLLDDKNHCIYAHPIELVY